MSVKELDTWFNYRRPSKEEAEVLQLLREAEEAVRIQAAGATHPALDKAIREFADVIDEVCPTGADKTAAFRCLRLARNAGHDSLFALKQSDALEEVPVELEQQVRLTNDLFFQQLRLARYNAGEAIQLAVAVALKQ